MQTLITNLSLFLTNLKHLITNFQISNKKDTFWIPQSDQGSTDPEVRGIVQVTERKLKEVVAKSFRIVFWTGAWVVVETLELWFRSENHRDISGVNVIDISI